jgi:hypothetical protein
MCEDQSFKVSSCPRHPTALLRPLSHAPSLHTPHTRRRPAGNRAAQRQGRGRVVNQDWGWGGLESEDPSPRGDACRRRPNNICMPPCATTTRRERGLGPRLISGRLLQFPRAWDPGQRAESTMGSNTESKRRKESHKPNAQIKPKSTFQEERRRAHTPAAPSERSFKIPQQLDGVCSSESDEASEPQKTRAPAALSRAPRSRPRAPPTGKTQSSK